MIQVIPDNSAPRGNIAASATVLPPRTRWGSSSCVRARGLSGLSCCTQSHLFENSRTTGIVMERTFLGLCHVVCNDLFRRRSVKTPLSFHADFNEQGVLLAMLEAPPQP